MTTFKKVTKNEKRAKMFLSHFSLHTKKIDLQRKGKEDKC
jgi:hypothetical protein